MKITDSEIINALNDGKTVRRKSAVIGHTWHGWCRITPNSTKLQQVWHDGTVKYVADFYIDDLVADDWEILNE